MNYYNVQFDILLSSRKCRVLKKVQSDNILMVMSQVSRKRTDKNK